MASRVQKTINQILEKEQNIVIKISSDYEEFSKLKLYSTYKEQEENFLNSISIFPVNSPFQSGEILTEFESIKKI